VIGSTDPRDLAVEATPEASGRGWRRFRRFAARDPLAVACALILLAVVFVTVFAASIAPYDPFEIRPRLRLAPPGTDGYLLGGDELGRDVLSRLLFGSRYSLIIGFAPVFVGLFVGGVLGLIAGFFGGLWDDLTMRVLEVFQAFPSILLALGIAAAIGPGLTNIIISLSVISVPYFARMVRSSTIAARGQDYVQAAHALGCPTWRIMWRHVLPNIASPIIVLVTLQAGRMMIFGAGLSFLGLGIRPPSPDWGSMLSAGQRFLATAPHLATIPGLVIFAVTACLNIVGDAVRDLLDPQQT
jgi:peptide/nickel transport system permease protein